jgi:hypothetical protein
VCSRPLNTFYGTGLLDTNCGLDGPLLCANNTRLDRIKSNGLTHVSIHVYPSKYVKVITERLVTDLDLVTYIFEGVRALRF